MSVVENFPREPTLERLEGLKKDQIIEVGKYSFYPQTPLSTHYTTNIFMSNLLNKEYQLYKLLHKPLKSH